MDKEEILEKIGLTKTESKIFLVLLKLGEAATPEIVKRVEMYKPTVYATLERLERKGLVSHITKEYKRVYSAANPKKFLDMLEERKEDFLSILPSLAKDFESGKPEREINVFVGREGLKTIFNEIMASKKDCDIIGSSLQIIPIMQHRFAQYLKKFSKSGMKFRAIQTDTPEVRKTVSELTKDFFGTNNWKVRFIPKNYFSPVMMNIFGEVAALTIWEDEPFVIRIKNRYVARTFRNYFNLLWRMAKL